MAYTKTNWQDRVVEFPNRYAKSDETASEITLTQSPGTVTQAGTPLNAGNMNKIEQGIADAHANAAAAQTAADNANANANTRLKKDGSEAMTGPLTLHAANGTNQFKAGTGDGASYTLYNLLLKLWWGMGIAGNDDTVRMFFDARVGKIDVKNGFYVDGQPVYHTGNKPVILEGIYTSTDTATATNYTSWTHLTNINVNFPIPPSSNAAIKRRTVISGPASVTFESRLAGATHYVELRYQIGSGAEVVAGSWSQEGVATNTYYTGNLNIDTVEPIIFRIYTRCSVSGGTGSVVTLTVNNAYQYFIVE